jgi:hypothetical protein
MKLSCRSLRYGLGLLGAFALVFSLAATVAAADGLSVEDAAICENVVDREPTDVGTSFPVSVGKLYCFTKIVGAEEPTEVTHVWYFGDQERARVSLAVRAANWRTYSSKVLQEHEIGNWRVEILDADGAILQTVDFEIVK